MVDWSKAYTSSWRVMRVNPDTWEDADELTGIRSVSIRRDSTEDAPLLETADVVAEKQADWDLEEGWYRVELLAEQGAEFERVALATLLMESVRGVADRQVADCSITGRSVLAPAADEMMADGEYAPARTDGAAWVASKLRACTPAPVEVEGSFTLEENVVFDSGSSVLKACWTVLDSANWCMRISGRGEVSISRMPDEPSLVLDTANAKLVRSGGVEYERDRSKVPNRYIAVDGKSSAAAVNSDPGSRVSTVRRGRNVDFYDPAPNRVDGESLQAYAERRLEEESTVRMPRTYSREYAEGVVPFCIVRGSIASVGLDGDLRVMSQDVECSHDVTVTETSGLEVKEYRAWQTA
ncbi:MAG: hypothetical protein IJ092_06260 [Atopobiaceae bacterium]|nr:hypothetical protein [Atopobiaceae bacterium]